MRETSLLRTMTVEEYFRFEEGSEVRHEYVSGELYAMSGATFRHSTLALNVGTRLHAAVGDGPCLVVMNDMRVQIAHDVEQRVVRALGATRTPEVFVFDRDRRLAYHGTVDDSRDDENAVTQRFLRDALDAILAGAEPVTTETSPQGCFVKWRPKAVANA